MDDGASGEDPITLETPRLILRQWQPADLDRYAELFADALGGSPVRRQTILIFYTAGHC
jgi:hypothetical protein